MSVVAKLEWAMMDIIGAQNPIRMEYAPGGNSRCGIAEDYLIRSRIKSPENLRESHLKDVFVAEQSNASQQTRYLQPVHIWFLVYCEYEITMVL